MDKAYLFLGTAAIALVLTLGAAAFWKLRHYGKLLPMLVGALTFFVFVNVLESGMHYFCLMLDNEISRFLNGNTVAYAAYGTLAAGIFEETGRFVAFKTLLRKYHDRKTAVSYGIGHGGMEVLLTVVANYILLAVAVLSVGGPNERLFASLLPSVNAIAPGICALALLERVFAMIAHISLSVPVFIAAREREKLWYYPLAILLHALLDVSAVLYQRGLLTLPMTELAVGIYATALALFAGRLYRKRI